MLKKDRQRFIEERLALKGTVTVKEIAAELSCSEETVRRELKDMEQDGVLHRVHGGAYTELFKDQIPVSKRKDFLVKEKTSIANLAFERYIHRDMTILLDDSTTCLTLAGEIVKRDLEITLITNSLNIMNLFGDSPEHTKLIGIGGCFREGSASFTGFEAENSIKNYYADVLFLSCPSVGMRSGLMHNVSEQCAVSRMMMKRSMKKILLVDHTKLKDHIRFLIADIDEVDAIITDRKPNDDWIRYLEDRKIDLIYPQPNGKKLAENDGKEY